MEGGFFINGKEPSPPDVIELEAVASKIAESGIRNVAVSGLYSFQNPAHEELFAKVLKKIVPDASVTLSHAFGNMGLLERENLAVLNECLKPLSMVWLL